MLTPVTFGRFILFTLDEVIRSVGPVHATRFRLSFPEGTSLLASMHGSASSPPFLYSCPLLMPRYGDCSCVGGPCRESQKLSLLHSFPLSLSLHVLSASDNSFGLEVKIESLSSCLSILLSFLHHFLQDRARFGACSMSKGSGSCHRDIGQRLEISDQFLPSTEFHR